MKLRQTRSRAVKLGPEHAKVFGTGGLELWNKFVAGRILTIGPPQTPLPGDWKCKPSVVFRLSKTSEDTFPMEVLSMTVVHSKSGRDPRKA